jgi:hypothetical protein
MEINTCVFIYFTIDCSYFQHNIQSNKRMNFYDCLITNKIFFEIIVTYTMKEIQAFASASSIAQEVLQHIRTVTAFHGQEKDEER